MKRLALFFICAAVFGTGVYIIKDRIKDDTKTVFIQRIKGSKLEKNVDYFTGIDITEDIKIDGIEQFEEKVCSHNLYADEVYIDEDKKAENFILECYAKGKIPYLIIKNREAINQVEFKKYADKMAEAIGRYDVALIVEVLENSYYYDDSGECYNYLSDKIKEENQKAKTVWSVKFDDLIFAKDYMPQNADYICINGYFKDIDEAERTFRDFFNFMNTDKRVIIRFGAAVYSSKNCTYTLDEAVKTIDYVYDKVEDNSIFGGIIYMDKNIKPSKKMLYTDYSITLDDTIISKYKEILEK